METALGIGATLLVVAMVLGLCHDPLACNIPDDCPCDDPDVGRFEGL